MLGFEVFLVASDRGDSFFCFWYFMLLDGEFCVLAAFTVSYISTCMSSRRKAFGGAFAT